MDKILRKKAIVAMELLARSAVDETVVDGWLMNGVPDGDIDYGNMDTDVVDDFYVEDKTFADIMGCFLRIMSRAKSDGLYIDDVLSK